MADYATSADIKNLLGGQWGPDQALGTGTTRDQLLATLVTRCSRLFDRETGRPPNTWGGAPTTRAYSGSGDMYLDIDEFDAITAVTMSSRQDRSDAVTLSLVPGQSDYVAFEPVAGPPWNRLYLLRGFIPDVYQVGNVRVVGTPTVPAEIADAVAIWTAYRWKRRDVGWQDTSSRPEEAGGGPPAYTGDIPPEVQRVIDYFKEFHGPEVAVVAGGAPERTTRWIGWQTTP